MAEACDGDIVITMLADDAAMEAVTFGDSGSPGILASLRPGATHVSSSTISVALSDRLAEAHAEAGQRFVPRRCSADPRPPPRPSCSSWRQDPATRCDSLGPVFDAIGQRTFVVSEEPKVANLIKLSAATS